MEMFPGQVLRKYCFMSPAFVGSNSVEPVWDQNPLYIPTGAALRIRGNLLLEVDPRCPQRVSA